MIWAPDREKCIWLDLVMAFPNEKQRPVSRCLWRGDDGDGWHHQTGRQPQIDDRKASRTLKKTRRQRVEGERLGV